jgi:hypothetical protein
MSNSILKSIWAVFAGFVSVFVLSVGTDFILESLRIFPPASGGLFVTWMLVLALVYRSAYAVLGSYVTTRLAPSRPARHAFILGIVGLIGALVGLITTWDKGLGPHWYPILLVILTPPSIWLGWKLAFRQR